MSEHVCQYHQFNLDAWLDWLAGRHPEEIQLGLARIQQVYTRLELSKPAKYVITVAGTNGKGSVVSLLEAIYVQAGYRVGAYTSPHLYQFNERIQVNRTPISSRELCDLFTWIEQNRDAVFLTYFEMVTLAAIAYFSQQELDVVILEVGMGGRMDAVNIIDHDCAVITTIDFDHQNYLGNTIEAIASEKAGIIRPLKPTIYGDYNLPSTIKLKAETESSPLYQLGEHFDFDVCDADILCRVDNDGFKINSNLHPQACVTAMMVVNKMQDNLPVREGDCIKAINGCRVPGRLEWINHRPMWLLDVAHNIQAVTRLYYTIQERPVPGRIRFVFAVFKDKPYAQMIELMAKLSQNWYIAQLANSRSASKLELMSEIRHHNGSYFVCDSVEQACEQAAIDADNDDLIVVFGSFITVQMAKGYLDKIGIT